MPNCKHNILSVFDCTRQIFDFGPCNLFGYLDECEMEFYNYLKISLESKNELEQ